METGNTNRVYEYTGMSSWTAFHQSKSSEKLMKDF